MENEKQETSIRGQGEEKGGKATTKHYKEEKN